MFPPPRARAWLDIGFPFQGGEENIVIVGALHIPSSADAARVLLVAFHMAFATLLASCPEHQRLELTRNMRALEYGLPSLLLELGPRTCLEKATWAEFIAWLRRGKTKEALVQRSCEDVK